MSRIYYAVFHYFRDFFLAHGLSLGRAAQAHANLYLGLLNSGFVPVARIATRVDDSRDARIRGDYELSRPVSQSYAVAAVRDGGQLVVDFQALLTTIPAQQIVDGVRNYLQSIGRIGQGPSSSPAP